MRPRLLILSIAVSLLVQLSISGQSVIVTPKKVVYKRTGKDVPTFKRRFEVRYPLFSGKVSPAVLRALKTRTNYWRHYDLNLAENLRGEDHWLSSFDYEVTYNKHNIFDIALTMEGTGAYPDGATEHLVFDLRTGKQLDFADVFYPSDLSSLVAKLRLALKEKEDEAIKYPEVRKTLADFREAEPEFYPPMEKIELKDIDSFSVSDTGVTFFYDYSYPHVAQALEPFAEIFIPYQDLKPFIRTDGLLAQFVR